MKRKLALIIAIVLVLGVSLAACTRPASQGVDTENYTITVGNTAATTGAFASVGVPFNYALEAYLWYFSTQTDGYKDEAGNKYTFNFIHYDDGFDGAVGATYTEKLVEDDKVFALVGHFGSNTVAATVDYLEEKGIPMVYGVTGVPQLFETERNIMTVQPIYNTEGMAMLATAVAPADDNMGLGGTKIGVIATTDEAGSSIKAGIMLEANKLGLVKDTNIFYFDVDAAATDYSAAVNGLKAKGCDVVIIASNQAPFINISKQFVTSNYENVKLITSYVSANATAMTTLATAGVMTETRRVFAGAWLYTGSMPSETKGWEDFVEFVRIMTLYAKHNNETLVKYDDPAWGATLNIYFGEYDWAADGVGSNWINSYAMAGYVAANAFCQGLERMSGEKLTWDAYINAMEEEPINIPMGLSVDYSNGQRIGIAALAVNEYTLAATQGTLYRNITALEDIEAAIEK